MSTTTTALVQTEAPPGAFSLREQRAVMEGLALYHLMRRHGVWPHEAGGGGRLLWDGTAPEDSLTSGEIKALIGRLGGTLAER